MAVLGDRRDRSGRRFEQVKSAVEEIVDALAMETCRHPEDPMLTYLVCIWIAGFETGKYAEGSISRKNCEIRPGTPVFDMLRKDCLAVMGGLD